MKCLLTILIQASAANPTSALKDLVADLPQLAKDKDFLSGVLVSLQNTKDKDGNLIKVDTSACQTSFEEFYDQATSLSGAQLIETYRLAREAKGAGDGTNIGFYMSQFNTYNGIMTGGFNFYQQCSLSYYMVALGSSFQNISGLSNVATNLGFRIYSGEDTSLTDLQTSLVAYTSDQTSIDNKKGLGNAAGNILRLFLQVEIPSTESAETPYYQSASSF